MLKRNIEHFETLRKAGEDYESRRKAHEEKKRTILEEHGWESEELAAWYEEKKEMTYPVPQGACKAYQAYQRSLERNAEELELDDFLWEAEVSDFLETMKKAEITSFIYTNTSTALMENLHQLADEGCTMDGLTKVERKNLWGEAEEVRGIHFTIR